MSTEKERKIGIGENYPYQKLGKYECVMTRKRANTLGIKAGDLMSLSIPVFDHLVMVYEDAFLSDLNYSQINFQTYSDVKDFLY